MDHGEKEPASSTGRTNARKRNSLRSIIDALSDAQDVETVATILNCRRKGSSPAIDEPCLQPAPFMDEVIENRCWETALFEHPKVLDRLLLCPSVYEIPWKAAVMAIRHCCVAGCDGGDDDKSNNNSAPHLDVDVSCFLQNVYLVWITNRPEGRGKLAQSPIKKLRQGETATTTTPAKWLLRMTEAVLATVNVGQVPPTVISTDRLKDLLSILASILSLASEFDSTLSLELLDRTFVRHQTRPDLAHVVLLHLTTRVDVQAFMRPADWRGLQSSLRNEAALAAVTSLPSEDRVELMSCIVRIGTHCHSLSMTSANKALKRWADILILSLRASNGDPVGENALVATFATLSAVDFKAWCEEFIRDDGQAKNRPPDLVARALVLLAQAREAGRDKEHGWKIDNFWKTMISISSWSSTESSQVMGVLYQGKGRFKGSDSMSRIGVIVYESLKLPNGDCNIETGRLWTRYTTQALMDVKLQAYINTKFAAAVIATVSAECRLLQKEAIGQLIESAADNVEVANTVAAAVAMLGDSLLNFLLCGANLVNLLGLPMSFEMLALLSSALSKSIVLQTQLFLFAQERLSALFTRECFVEDDPVDANSEQAKRPLLVLMDLLEKENWSDFHTKAWHLIAGVVISNNPPIPVEARSWLYRTLGERVNDKRPSKEHHLRYCRICLLRALTFFDDVGAHYRFESAFMKSRDSLVQLEDFTGLFELLLLLHMSVDLSAFYRLRRIVVQSFGRSCDEEASDTRSYHLVSEAMLVHFPFMIGRAIDHPLHVKRFFKKLNKEEFQDSVPTSIRFGPVQHAGDSSGQLEAELITANEKRIQFHSQVRLILSSEVSTFDNSQNDARRDELRLVAISRCVTDHLHVLQESHVETVSLVFSATTGFCMLMITSFNQIVSRNKRAADVDTILAALAVLCEVATDMSEHCGPLDIYRRLKSSWEVYGLVAEERNARKIVSYLERNCAGARNVCWGIDGNSDDNVRRVRSGLLRWFRMCLERVLDVSNALEALMSKLISNCIQIATKRLCKDLWKSQEGQSGGLSSSLYGQYIGCIDFGLQILEAYASRHDDLTTLSLDDTAISCASIIKKVVTTLPLQQSTSLKKTLLVWLWQAPKLLRTLFVSKLQREFTADDTTYFDHDVILSQCFDQVFTIALRMVDSSRGTPWSLENEASADHVWGKSTSRAPVMLKLSNEKMWAAAFTAIMQVVRNHCNESIQRIENHQYVISFPSVAAMNKFCLSRTGQLRSLLHIIGATLTIPEGREHKPGPEPRLIAIELPLPIKTETSLTCDAFLGTLRQALMLLSEENDDILDTDRFAEATACMVSWLTATNERGEEVLCQMLLWQSGEPKAGPQNTSETLQRRLNRIATKVNDLSKIIRCIVSNNSEMTLIDQLEETFQKSSNSTSSGFKKMLRDKLKLLEKVIVVSPQVHGKQSKKRRRATKISVDRNPIVGQWLDIDREKGRENSAKDDEFDDLDDFIVNG